MKWMAGCAMISLWVLSTAVAFSRPMITTLTMMRLPKSATFWQSLRGGQQHDLVPDATTATVVDEAEFSVTDIHAPPAEIDVVDQSTGSAPVPSSGHHSHTRRSLLLTPVLQVGARLGPLYARMLDQYPIRTKSFTAGFVFGLSDYLAQRLEASAGHKDTKRPSLNWTRALVSAAVGLFYFGPAAHYWYDMIFRILPGTSLWSTLQKAALGQLIFGPSFTCIFFATSLMQAGSFSLSEWGRKTRRDLPGAWLAGIGFWPLVDLVSYKLIAKEWIPLFVNMCSLVWTIYLSLIANRKSARTA